MKFKTHRPHGLSLLEVCLIIATIALLSVIFDRQVSYSQAPSQRIRCIGNLKQVGMSFRLYSEDHEDNFPWMVSTNFNPTNTPGSREFTNSAQVFRHFQVASNELNSPNILVCPTDRHRKKAPNFIKLNNTNLSYFVGLDAVESDPQLILSGDRNILGGTLMNSHLLLVRTNSALSWSNTMHIRAGNVGLADGSVQQITDARLIQQVTAVTNAVVRFAIP